MQMLWSSASTGFSTKGLFTFLSPTLTKSSPSSKLSAASPQSSLVSGSLSTITACGWGIPFALSRA